MKITFRADRIKTDTIKKNGYGRTQSIINAYKSGELNFISVDYTVMDEYKDSDELIASPSQTSYYVLFNVNEAPFDDVRVRQAFSMAVNRDEVASACGSSYEASDFFVAKHPGNPPQAARTGQRKQRKIRSALIRTRQKSSGRGRLPDGEGFRPSPTNIRASSLTAIWHRPCRYSGKTNLGIEVELQAEEQQVQVAERRSGDFQLARMRWTADFTDPFTFLSMYRSNDSYNDNKTNCRSDDELMAMHKEAIRPPD